MIFAVVAHDAGAAELLCAFAKQYEEHATWHFFALEHSPMYSIARQYGFQPHNIDESEASLAQIQPDALLFGTGWQTKVERPFVHYCKIKGIPTFAFLDHWSNYRERFDYPNAGWEKNLPDITVVSDEKALCLAQKLRLPKPIKINNYYLKTLLDSIPIKAEGSSLLFLSEPTDKVAKANFNDPFYWGFTQNSALKTILENFERFHCTSLSIRLHPSEMQSSYHALLKKFPHIKAEIYPAKLIPLEKQLSNSKVIIGFDTMALYIAALMHKPVISYLPSKNREFLLPLPSSHQIRNLNLLSSQHLKPLKLDFDNTGINFTTFLKFIKDQSS